MSSRWKQLAVLSSKDFLMIFRSDGDPCELISNMESSFAGHTVDALVLTGDEGRDKLR